MKITETKQVGELMTTNTNPGPNPTSHELDELILFLATYDIILVNTSGGKDSQAMLDYVMMIAVAGGLADRVRVVHADLGRVEWKGTKELAADQAAHYNLGLIVTRRTQNDLLEQVEDRGMWPDSARRYCTSDHKRGPIQRVIVAESKPIIKETGTCRVLNCMGIRAQESPARAKKAPFENNKRASTQKRTVDNWLPIFDWQESEVWARIKSSGVPHHPAYDAGMSRLSCVFCVFASRRDLEIAGRNNRELLTRYVEVETRIGHDFKKGQPLAELEERLAAEDVANFIRAACA